MNSNLTELVFILDRSGSMSGLERETIGGFNGMIGKQKAEPGEALVTTVLFDTEIQILHDRIRLSEIGAMTEKEYFVRGCTALLDAIGTTVERIAAAQKYAREEDRPARTVIVITTDGMENASRHYSDADIKNIVGRQREAGWEFLFLGANIDAAMTARSCGISESRAVNYCADTEGTSLNYRTLAKALSMARHAPSAEAMREMFDSEDLLADVRADHARRGRH